MRSPIGTVQKTGQKCIESGKWAVVNVTPSTTAPIAKGNIFPPYRNQSVSWKLTAYA